MPKWKSIVYALIDPRDGRCRYIGKGSRGLQRAKHHEYEARCGHKGYCNNWIRQLQDSGLRYIICVLEEMDSGERLCERERWWIAFARAWGCSLTNVTDGGEGIPGFTHTEQTRQKMQISQRAAVQRQGEIGKERKRLVMLDHWAKPGMRQMMAANMRAANASDEVSQRRREACAKPEWKAAHGRPEVREKIRAAVSSFWATPEGRNKMCAASRRFWSNREGCAHILAHRSDPERRDKIRAGVLAAYERPGVRERRLAALATPEVRKRISDGVRAARARQRVLAVQWGPL